MNKKMEQVRRARERISKARDELQDALKAAFPLGTQAVYDQGGNRVFCVVTGFGFCGDRVFVRSENSGKEYWINAYRLTLPA